MTTKEETIVDPADPIDRKRPPSLQLAKSTSVVSGLTLVSRVLGLCRDMAIASFFGAGFATDAFFVAFKVPNLLRRLVAEGSLSSAFVPIFTDELNHSQKRARDSIGSIASFTLSLTLLLTALGMFFAPEITDLFAPGFSSQPGKSALASSLLQLMFPYVILVSLLALAASTLNCLGHFAWPASAPAILNISIITLLLLLAEHLDDPIYCLAWAVLLGGVLQLIPQLFMLRKLGFRLHFRSPFHSPPVRKLIRLMLPAVLSASVYQLMVFINTLLASVLEEGSVSWLYFADRIFQFPLGVFSIAVATVMLPALSKAASAGDIRGMQKQLGTALNWVTFVTIPASTGLFVLADPIVRTVFEHGDFGSYDAENTAAALCAYSLGLWAISCQTILVRSFLAKKNTLIPALISCFALFFNVILALAMMGPSVGTPQTVLAELIASCQNTLYFTDFDHIGLALAGSLASFFSLGALYLCLPRVGLRLSLKPIFLCFIKTLCGAILMAAVLILLGSLELSPLFTLLLGVPAGILSFGLSTLLLKSEEAATSASIIRKRFLKTDD